MPYERIRRGLLILTAVLVCALAVLTVVFLVTKFAPPASEPPAAETNPGDIDLGTPAETDDTVTLPETPDAGMSYQDSIVFVGDSLTAHLVSRGALTGGSATTQVWRTESFIFNLKPGANAQEIIYPGPGAQAGTPMTVAEAAALATPDVLVITLGADWGVAYLDEQTFTDCYTELVRGIRAAAPKTAVLLQSIFPVSEGCTTLSNTAIDQANRWVKAIAAETGCRSLDTQSVLKDATGCLKAEFSHGTGGIHLNAAGYEAVLGYIRTHAVG